MFSRSNMVNVFAGSVGTSRTLYNKTATKNGSVLVKATFSNDTWTSYDVRINNNNVVSFSGNGNTTYLNGVYFQDEFVVLKGQTIEVRGNQLYIEIDSNL